MRAFSSGSVPGWVVGLQGLSDTLGGSADAIRQDRALEQRQQAEARRQQAQDLEIQQAQEKIQARRAQQGFQFKQAQQQLGSEQDALMAQLQGGPPTVDQDQELQQLAELTKELKPETAGVVLDHYRNQKASQFALQRLNDYTQEMTQLVTEGTVQDPQYQQALEPLLQEAQTTAQEVQAGVRSPNDAVQKIEELHARQQQALDESEARQQDLQMRQTSAQGIEQQMAMAGNDTAKFAKLMQIRDAVLHKRITPQEANRLRFKEELNISDEEYALFEQAKAAKEAEQTALQAQMFQQAQAEQQAQIQRQAQAFQEVQAKQDAQDKSSQVKLDRFGKGLEALKKKKGKVTGDDIRTLQRRYGLTDEDLQGLLGG